MGRMLAESFYSHGAKVTIMARTQAKLDKAVNEIESKVRGPEGASIKSVAVDVTDAAQVDVAMHKAVEMQDGEAIFCLVVAAGRAIPGYFLDQDIADFRATMELNYFGALNCAKTVVPLMAESQTKGQILFISSAAAGASFLGYTSYAPTKFALRGLADGLRNEIKGLGISVHIAYPPDTDTPGFEEENKSKPKETLQISPPEVHSAKSVTDAMMDGLLRGEYHLPSPDPVQNLLVSTTVNITPRGRWAPLEILLSPILGVAMLIFKVHADSCSVPYGKAKAKELAKIQ
ncbi:3-ketodihydrosphingosine reductase (KDS reductase) (3-dehydrosphinganine reductase) [Durusdinium trenchii]|uniref:3-dehydrosphinganine reductase n=1 Tax=Durusdinium trenchii TaxID=1381693 RepID=A0ABP0JA42_9DINO